MTDRPESTKGSWYRRAPRANKVDLHPAAQAPAQPPRARYGSCLDEIPEVFACARTAPVNIAARRPGRGDGAKAASDSSVVGVGAQPSRDPPVVVPVESPPAPTSQPPASEAGQDRSSAPTRETRASTPGDDERTTLPSTETHAAPSRDQKTAGPDEAPTDDEVIVVGETDVVEFIPVGDNNVAPSITEQDAVSQVTPAALPMTSTASGEAARGVAVATSSASERSPARKLGAAAFVIAACLSIGLWAAHDRVASWFESPRTTAASPGMAQRHAKPTRLAVPEMVVSVPTVASNAPALASAPAARPAAAPPRRAGMSKDAAALAELEKLAAGLPSGAANKKK